MNKPEIHQCQCKKCQQVGDHSDKEGHHQMNVLLSRLDEQQRRWYAALEAKKLGRGGMTQMALITGLSVETIRRGQRELEADLVGRPTERVRQPGGGRKAVEKKTRALSKP